MITVNYGLTLRLKGTRKKRQGKNCQGLELDLNETQSKKIRAAIRAKHPGWILEGYVIVKSEVKRKKKKIIINREELIEQVTVYLHSSASDEQTFNVSNMLLGTRLFVKDHVLVSRI